MTTDDWEQRIHRVKEVMVGSEHSVEYEWTTRGQKRHVLLKWTAPPQSFCPGDSLTYRLEYVNYTPIGGDSGAVAYVSGYPLSPFHEGTTCTKEVTDRYLLGDMASLVYECTAVFGDSQAAEEVAAFEVYAGFSGSDYDGIGIWVQYLYTKGAAPPPEVGSDQDGLTDDREADLGTNPNDPETDDDGKSDAEEVADATDPLDPSDRKGAGPDVGRGADPCADVGPGTWIVIESRSKSQGSTVRIPVSLCGASGLGDLNFSITYDPSILRATGFTRGAFLGNALFDANLVPEGTIRLGMADNEGLTGDGCLTYLDFDVIGEPGSKTTPHGEVTTASRADNDQRVQVLVKDGTFTVEGVKGDVDGDKRLTSRDALMALQMSIGKIAEDLIVDVDGDGGVTGKDARWILQAATGLRTP